MNNKISGLSTKTQKIQDYLESLQKGDEVTYWEIEQNTGFDIRKESSAYQSACRRMRNRVVDPRVIITVRGQGIKRLTDEDIVKYDARFKRGKKQFAMRRKELNVPEMALLTEAVKHQLLAEQALTAFFMKATRPNVQRQLINATSQLRVPKSPELLALFKERG